MLPKKIAALLAALAIALGFNAVAATAPVAGPDSNPVVKAVAPAPAAAAWGTTVGHAADDSGYVADIHVVCDDGRHFWLSPGERTFLGQEGKTCTMAGVSKIIVGYNQTVYCKNYTPPYENTYFYTGTNSVPSGRTYKCYMQRPL